MRFVKGSGRVPNVMGAFQGLGTPTESKYLTDS